MVPSGESRHRTTRDSHGEVYYKTFEELLGALGLAIRGSNSQLRVDARPLAPPTRDPRGNRCAARGGSAFSPNRVAGFEVNQIVGRDALR